MFSCDIGHFLSDFLHRKSEGRKVPALGDYEIDFLILKGLFVATYDIGAIAAKQLPVTCGATFYVTAPMVHVTGQRATIMAALALAGGKTAF